MKKIITIILFLFVLPSSAQDLTPTPEKQFKRDLENNMVRLYILGGFAPRHYENDAQFQKKYNISFHDFGCLAPANLSFYSDYNLLVFEYLKNKWGKTWEDGIRKDILGWNKWKPET